MNAKQDFFMEWLVTRIPSSSLSDYYLAVSEIEDFARKKRIFLGSLFDVEDATVTGKLVSSINSDKIFRFRHKKQMKTIVDLAQLFHKYTKENESRERTQNVAPAESIVEGIEKRTPISAVIVERDQNEQKDSTSISIPSGERGNEGLEEEASLAAESVVDMDETATEGYEESNNEGGNAEGVEKRLNRTYFRDDMEQFFIWLGKDGSLTVQARKNIISALRIAQMFLQENISPELALFSDDKSVVNVSICALLSDPDFKLKNDERQGRYYDALTKLRDFYAQSGKVVESGEETATEGSKDSSVIVEQQAGEGQHFYSSVQEMLSAFGVPFWRASKAYLFVERKDIPDSVLRRVRQSEDVVSVTSIKRYGNKDCWRIHLKDSGISDKREPEADKNDESASTIEKPSAQGAEEPSHSSPIKGPGIDPIIALFDNMDIQYIDNRSKDGRLWMLGDMSLKETAAWLRKNGHSFVYCYRGSKSTGWKSAWYLDESNKSQRKADENVVEHIEKSETTDIPSQQLTSEVAQLLTDSDMQPLRVELEKQGILTIDRLKTLNLWAFMNQFAIYNIRERQDVYKRVLSQLSAAESVDHDRQFKLETRTATYYGDSPAEAFTHFCEDIAQKYPLKIRSLLGVKFNGQGSVVLSRVDLIGNSIKMMNPVAYVNRDLTTQAAIVYGQWICKMCGDNDPPVKISEPIKTPSEENSAPLDKRQLSSEVMLESKDVQVVEDPAEKPVAKQQGEDGKEIIKAEQIVLKADLDVVTLEELCEELRITMVATKKIAASSTHIVQLGEKVFHVDAFVDWEDGADQLERILDKLLDRNGGYVSAAQLYEFAHSEMQMFLNDNDMDESRLVYDMAQHLFEKVGYHGKHLVFQSKSHISRSDTAVTNVMDLMRNYAKSQGGVFFESDLVQYLQSVGVKTGNLRGLMKVYTHPVFMFYDKGQFILGESMKIDGEWLSIARKAIDNLFDDMGDHIVFRDVQPWWFAQLPPLPAGRPWTHLLLQNVLQHYSDQLGGAHTINAMSGQSADTIHAMIVSKDSEIQTFPDAVIAHLIDDHIEQREFDAEELRQHLVQRGLIAGNELIWNMPKALSNDGRFAWDASGQKVSIKV